VALNGRVVRRTMNEAPRPTGGCNDRTAWPCCWDRAPNKLVNRRPAITEEILDPSYFVRCGSRVTLRLRNGILDFGNALFGPIEVHRSRNGVAENWKNILKRREHLSVNAPQSAVLIRKPRRVY
jgi:hypothetical protein